MKPFSVLYCNPFSHFLSCTEGESSVFRQKLDEHKIPWILAINSTSFVMTNLQGKTHQIKKILGNLYGLRTWIEYGFRQCKQELGWADYRLTKFEQIEKWWEIIMSAYWMISCHSQLFCTLNQSQDLSSCNKRNENAIRDFSSHPQWSTQSGWKSTLNNLRLIIQPITLLCLIFPWLDIFPNQYLCLGFHHLIDTMNQFQPFYSSG